MPSDQTRGIVHVAAASEDRGRVVLQLRSGSPNRIAMLAAARIARAFGASIEGVFIEDQQLIDLAAHGFIREVSRWSGERRLLSPELMARELAAEARFAHARILDAAASAEVPLRLRVMRDEPLRAMAIACAECGPWNVIVIAEPFQGRDGERMAELLEAVSAATGVVVVGPRAVERQGPVVVVLEDIERLPQMVRAAGRLLEEEDASVLVLVLGASPQDVEEREGQARLAMADAARLDFAGAIVPDAGHAAAADVLRRLAPGLVIAQIGGRVVPIGEDLSPLASVLCCPLFVVR